MMQIRSVLVAAVFTAAFPVFGDVKIVDSVSVDNQQRQQQQVRTDQAQVEASAQLFYQLQMLQEEVMRLQGMLEQQQHELARLKQQRMDDYLDLDGRIAALSAAPAVVPPSSVAPQQPTSRPVLDENEYASAYQAAYDRIPKRQFKEAREAFEAFLQRYPGTPYQANALYWLGELYLIDGNTDKARASFSTILQDYPEHNKFPEALYKMAIIHHDQGDKTTARQQLETLIERYSGQPVNAAVIDKARAYLQKNFP